MDMEKSTLGTSTTTTTSQQQQQQLKSPSSSSSAAAAATYSDSPDVNHSLVSKLFTACQSAAINQNDVTKQLITLDLQQLDLNSLTNSVGETPVHISAASGNLEMLKILIDKGVSINAIDRNGDTPLIISTRNDRVDITNYLLEKHADLNVQNENKETALHEAVKMSNGSVVESLILSGANPNIFNSFGETPLHLACKNSNVPIASMLIYLGANMVIKDQHEETSLHVAVKNGLYSVVQLMCSKNINVNLTNKAGSTALHLAAKSGFIDIVRVLLLAGADIDQYDKDGFSAEDLAVTNGYKEINDLILDLTGLITDRRSLLAKQLVAGNSQMDRLKVKVVGSREVGKTTLIESLKCSYMWSIIRKVYGNFGGDKAYEAPTELLKSGIEPPLVTYTKGVDVQQVTIPGIGNLSIWDFSGYEPYYSYYDFFIGDPSCIHVITFSLADDVETWKYQVYFWLEFIKARISQAEPIGMGGHHLWAPHIVFVATHADVSNCPKHFESGEYIYPEWKDFCKELMEQFSMDFVILKKLHVLDSREPNSIEMKDLKRTLAKLKEFLLSYHSNAIGLLSPVVKEIPNWVRSLGLFPVVTWSTFVTYVRKKVNILATEEHIRELVGQLQVVGEIVYLISSSGAVEDLIVLNPKWFTNRLLGETLSYEIMCHCPLNGLYTPEQLKLFYQNLDISDLKNILKSLDICLESIYPDGRIFYEFPALNFTPHPDDVWSGWLPSDQNFEDKKDGEIKIKENNNNNNNNNNNKECAVIVFEASPSPQTSDDNVIKTILQSTDSPNLPDVWHGIQLGCVDYEDTIGDQIGVIFPRIVLAVKRALTNQEICPVLVRELRQWASGLRMDCDGFATVVSLSITQQHVDIISRGIQSATPGIFQFSEYICQSLSSEMTAICPGLNLQRFPMSPIDLRKPTTSTANTAKQPKENDFAGINEAFQLDESIEDLTKESTERSADESTYFVRVYDSKEIIEAQMSVEPERTFDELNNNLKLTTQQKHINLHSYTVKRNITEPENKNDDIVASASNAAATATNNDNVTASSNDAQNIGSGEKEKKDSVEFEKLIDLIAMGSEELFSKIILGKNVHISQLPLYARCLLANLLDSETSSSPSQKRRFRNRKSPTRETISLTNELNNSKDWKALAKILQVSDNVVSEREEQASKSGDVTVVPVSKTDAVLALWSYKVNATIGNLAVALKELGRLDARDVLLRSAPAFLYLPEVVSTPTSPTTTIITPATTSSSSNNKQINMDAVVNDSAA